MKKLDKGFTLIEVILALSIFAIIFVGFLTLFSSSLKWIILAGDRGKAYSTVQGDIEKRIHLEDSEDTDNLIIEFGDTEKDKLIIPGGLVTSTKEISSGSSELETFLPYVPTITLDKTIVYEGDLNREVIITGKNTHFNSSKTIIQILNYDGTLINGFDSITPTVVNSKTELKFNLPANLYDNSISLENGKYIVRVITSDVENVGNEYARAKLFVEQPKYMIVGNNHVFISSNGKDWLNRTGLFYNGTLLDVNGVVTNGTNFILFERDGRVHYSVQDKGWYSSYVASGESVNNIVWITEHMKYFALTESGRIYSSETGQTWYPYLSDVISQRSLYSMKTQVLNDTTTVINAVGDETIVRKVNEGAWDALQSGLENIMITSIASSNSRFVAVGYNKINDHSLILTSSDGVQWSIVHETESRINEISATIMGMSSNPFIAIGDSGLIWNISFNELDEINITNMSLNYVDMDFVDIFRQGTIIVIVSANGNVFYSDNDGSTYSRTDLGSKFGISDIILESIDGR